MGKEELQQSDPLGVGGIDANGISPGIRRPRDGFIGPELNGRKKSTVKDELLKLSDPSFWDEFSQDLSHCPEEVPFAWFLQFYTPGMRDAKPPWKPSKYKNLFKNIYNSAYSEKALSNGSSEWTADNSREMLKKFYVVAPEMVKLQLQGRFPRVFGKLEKEVLTSNDIVPEAVRSLVTESASIRSDSRSLLLDKVASYISSKRTNDEELFLPQPEIKRLLEQVSDPHHPDSQKPPVESIAALSSDVSSLELLFQEGESEDRAVAQSAKEIIAVLDQTYYTPLFKSLLYKPAARFWSQYLHENPGSRGVPPPLLTAFLRQEAEGQLTGSFDSTEGQMVAKHFQTEVLPHVYDDFAQSAAFASEIAYFKAKDHYGRGKHLFLHQVEAIRQLSSEPGGILSDEPGTGKTVILALTALKKLDMKDIPSNRPGRILVVGGKTIIDNWQSELATHIETEDIEVINVNFTHELPSASVKQRLNKVEGKLRVPTKSKQLVMVNYDLFRQKSFTNLLKNYPFDVAVVDEAHNIKSRFLASILQDSENNMGNPAGVAKRTSGLYGFLKGSPEMNVYLMTSTPFVKELLEPLIMGHLARPDLISSADVARLQYDVAGTNRLLSQVMLRRKKEEIADLPEKTIQYTAIDLGSMDEQSQIAYATLAEELKEANPNQLSHFYSLLALENQAKYPWLIDTVTRLTSEGRKVVVFTPFTLSEARHTASISTRAIATKLYKAGITSVGVLDGQLNEQQRLVVQEDFRRKSGKRVLVGNYQIAGESITLNSPENRATEVILFIAPNMVSRYIQAIDRIHRFGQSEEVTIHIPYITRRDRGQTYDELLVRSLTEELSTFGAVVDGLFFLEAKDIYSEASKLNLSQFSLSLPPGSFSKGLTSEAGLIDFTPPTLAPKAQKKITTSWMNQDIREIVADTNTKSDWEPHPIEEGMMLDESDIAELLAKDDLDSVMQADGETGKWFNTNDAYEKREIKTLSDRIRGYPVLSKEQEEIVYTYYTKGLSLEQLQTDEAFLATITTPSEKQQFAQLFQDSQDVKNLFFNANLRLVAWQAWKYTNRGLPWLDLFQEGSIGLMKGIHSFDIEKGKFSTHGTWWVKQAMSRAAADQGRTIRIPVHHQDDIYAAKKLLFAFYQEHNRRPTSEELTEVLSPLNRNEESIANILSLLAGAGNVASLDTPVTDESDMTLGELVADSRSQTEALAVASADGQSLQLAIDEALSMLTERERWIIKARQGIGYDKPQTLEQLASIAGVTREWIRQLEDKAMGKLRRQEWKNPQLKHWWDENLPQPKGRQESQERLVVTVSAQPHSTTGTGKTAGHTATRESAPLRHERQQQLSQYKFAQAVMQRGRQDQEIWEVLSPQERSMVAYYFQGDEASSAIQKRRLARIFQTDEAAIEQALTNALTKLDTLLLVKSVEAQRS